ncbi:hypothetical protein [Flavobacterium columnare]
MDFSILSAFLPEELLCHFDIVDFIELGDIQAHIKNMGSNCKLRQKK